MGPVWKGRTFDSSGFQEVPVTYIRKRFNEKRSHLSLARFGWPRRVNAFERKLWPDECVFQTKYKFHTFAFFKLFYFNKTLCCDLRDRQALSDQWAN
jgi:hypothetical protein